jgi:hypothetical protein
MSLKAYTDAKVCVELTPLPAKGDAALCSRETRTQSPTSLPVCLASASSLQPLISGEITLLFPILR